MASMAKRVDVADKGKYRKVDVDAIDEDQYRDEETDDSGQEQQVNQRAQEVRQLLSKGNVREAVAKALESPPLGSKNHAVKVRGHARSLILEKRLASRAGAELFPSCAAWCPRAGGRRLECRSRTRTRRWSWAP